METADNQGRTEAVANSGDMTAILARVEVWTASPEEAWAWYRGTPLPGFGGRTAETLVREGHGNAVHRYLDEVAHGGFA